MASKTKETIEMVAMINKGGYKQAVDKATFDRCKDKYSADGFVRMEKAAEKEFLYSSEAFKSRTPEKVSDTKENESANSTS